METKPTLSLFGQVKPSFFQTFIAAFQDAKDENNATFRDVRNQLSIAVKENPPIRTNQNIFNIDDLTH
jgi:hypothetical protein